MPTNVYELTVAELPDFLRELLIDFRELVVSENITDVTIDGFVRPTFRKWIEILRDENIEELNKILVAGGTIFPDETTGRQAAVDGGYYLAESQDPMVAFTIWERVDASTSRHVADAPSVEYTAAGIQMARDGRLTFAYPNMDYGLTYPVEVTVDHKLNIITAIGGDGSITSIQKYTDDATQYPFTSYSDDQISASVDRKGGIIDIKTLRQAFGQYTAYPYQTYAETGELKQVNKNGNIVAAPSRWGGNVFVDLDGKTNDLFVVWPHGKDKMLRVNYRPNGVNDLFNWRSTEIAAFGDPSRANWNTIASTNSDSWPPLIFEAVNNGDGGTSIYTGGNHSSDGGTGGVPTAYMSHVEFSVDGRRLRRGEGFSGYADSVQAFWRNEIMAFNTITLDRYPITQEIRCEFHAGDISGFVAITANEPVTMGLDNGPQMFSNGYETYHYYDGQQQATLPIPDSGTNTSGLFRDFPAWATVFSHPEHGFHGAWLDREFEAGDGRYITGSAGAFRKGSGTKFYSIIVGTADLNMATGDSYEYHGGYFWSPSGAVSGGVDSAFTFHKRGAPHVGYALTSAASGALHLPLWAEGQEVAGAGVAGINGVEVSAGEYTTFDPAIINSFGLRRENHTGTQPLGTIDGLSEELNTVNTDTLSKAASGRYPISSFAEEPVNAVVDTDLGFAGGEDVAEGHEIRLSEVERLGGRYPISSFAEEPVNVSIDESLGIAGGNDVSEAQEIRLKAVENVVSLVYRGHVGQGQSNARGAGEPTPSPLTSSADFSGAALMPGGVNMNVALGTGLGGSYDLIDPADFQGFQGLKSEQLSASNGTTFLEGMGFRQASCDQQAGTHNRRIYWTAAEGGVSLAARSPGTDAYSNTLAATERSVEIAALNSGSYVVESIHSIEGEADTATVNFDDALIDVYANQLTADIKARTGQQFDPWIIASQPSSFYGSVEGVLGIYRACRDNPRFNLASAGYHLPYYSDLLHYSPLGHLLMGEYHQKVLETLRRGEVWRPVSPKFMQWDGGSVLTVWFHAPVLPIVLDPGAPHHGDFGFVVRSDGQNMDIASITVVGPDCIEITTANPIGANRSLQYAMRGYPSSPRVEGDGPKGALRDSDDRSSVFDGRPLYNWGVHFVEDF